MHAMPVGRGVSHLEEVRTGVPEYGRIAQIRQIMIEGFPPSAPATNPDPAIRPC
jgi:hypothetical protein